jgi:hypothetical protein
MKRIGVYICNYNGKEYLLNCLDSLFRQTLQDFDVCVVDNASTDGSADAVRASFGSRVEVLCNSENLGGSGGFDRGLRTGLARGYRYIALLDNDIILDDGVLEHMTAYLDARGDVGLVGSKVMIMDRPDVLQDYGDYLDFGVYREKFGYGGHKDDGSLPLENLCDYVPSCAVMVRGDILRRSGTMPADNFIYYDDIELCHKIRLAGGKIVALGNAKVWHKGGFRKEEVSTFSRYYFLRNRLHFFAKYIAEEDIGRFIDTILQEVFSQLAGFYGKGMEEMFHTAMYAFDDFLHLVRGKAAEGKILPIRPRKTPLMRAVGKKRPVVIKFRDKDSGRDTLDAWFDLLRILAVIQKSGPRDEIGISLEQCGCTPEEFEQKFREATGQKEQDYPLPKICLAEEWDVLRRMTPGTGDDINSAVTLRMCGHVKNVTVPVLPEIYVDKYGNCITSGEEYRFFTNLDTNARFFAETYRPIMLRAVRSIRKDPDAGAKIKNGGTKPLMITNIQRMCFHDGPGIRTTVFAKGCSLHCPWCSNPENLSFAAERYEKDGVCGVYGKAFTAEELVKVLIKDRDFWGAQGGVTFSGGEALMQAEALEAVLRELKGMGVHTALETALFVPQGNVRRVLPYLDTVIADVKILEPDVCREILGGDVARYRENVDTVYRSGRLGVFRVPCCGEYTLTSANKDLLKEFLRQYPDVPVQIFAIHGLGEKKYQSLGRTMWRGQALDRRVLEEFSYELMDAGIRAEIIQI